LEPKGVVSDPGRKRVRWNERQVARSELVEGQRVGALLGVVGAECLDQPDGVGTSLAVALSLARRVCEVVTKPQKPTNARQQSSTPSLKTRPSSFAAPTSALLCPALSSSRLILSTVGSMAIRDSAEHPDLAAALGSVFAGVSREQQPLLAALAERMAAERYRSWAADPANGADAFELLACAEREEKIAGLVESLDARAAGIQSELLAKNPNLEAINRGVFEGHPLCQQFATQAEGERLGAAMWRAFASEHSGSSRETFLVCVELEEASAAVLEAILARTSAAQVRRALEYNTPATKLTLAEGLREYYANNEGLVDGRSASVVATEFFRCHDAAHVVFGCTTELRDEALVKIWSFLGTTAGFGLLRAYRLPESKEIYKQIEWSDVVSTVLQTAGAVPLVVWRCFAMHKKWPWADFDGYLDVSLVEIRREYGVRLVAP
jgi:hypothetical protein